MTFQELTADMIGRKVILASPFSQEGVGILLGQCPTTFQCWRVLQQSGKVSSFSPYWILHLLPEIVGKRFKVRQHLGLKPLTFSGEFGTVSDLHPSAAGLLKVALDNTHKGFIKYEAGVPFDLNEAWVELLDPCTCSMEQVYQGCICGHFKEKAA